MLLSTKREKLGIVDPTAVNCPGLGVPAASSQRLSRNDGESARDTFAKTTDVYRCVAWCCSGRGPSGRLIVMCRAGLLNANG